MSNMENGTYISNLENETFQLPFFGVYMHKGTPGQVILVIPRMAKYP
jgi:hypothetical protein